MKMIDNFKIKNNKGFSMVELLAVIVIFGIISTVGVVTVSKVVESSRDRYYESQKNALIMAAKAYVSDNRSALPKKVGQRKKIDLGTLREKNYLKEDIKDRNKNKCQEDSYVSIFKINKTEYNYTAYLRCPACNNNFCDTQSDDKPVINIDMIMTENKFENISAKIEMSGNADKDKLLYSYQYKIYKNGSLVYTSKEERKSEKEFAYDITDEVKKHVPGIIKVVVVATNEDGISTTKTKSYNFKNSLNPACGNVHPNLNTIEVNGVRICADDSWNKLNGDLYIECNEVNGIKCKKHEFSKHFDNDSIALGQDTIDIEDVEGNIAHCQVYTCQDNASPRMVIRVYKRSSTGGKDGTAINTYTITSNDTTIKDLGYINSSYPYGIYFEVNVSDNAIVKSYNVKYNVPNLYGSDANSTNLPNTTANSNDSLYKPSEVFTHYFDGEGRRYLKITTTDGAGHVISAILKADIDLTAPVATISGSSNNYNLKSTISDSGSGLKQYHWSADEWTSVSGSSKTVKKEGLTDGLKYKVYVEDNAGNSGESDYIKAYKLCDSTKITPSDWPSDAVYLANNTKIAKTFKWINMDKHCGASQPYIEFEFKEIACKCIIDKKTNKYCGVDSWNDYSTLTHGDNKRAYIYYRDDHYGRDACNGHYTLNSYVDKVCEKNIGTETEFHGYYFYSGYRSNAYSTFNPTEKWTHNGNNYNDRVSSGVGGKPACRKACDSNY